MTLGSCFRRSTKGQDRSLVVGALAFEEIRAAVNVP
jgi:hypothetical protein